MRKKVDWRDKETFITAIVVGMAVMVFIAMATYVVKHLLNKP